MQTLCLIIPCYNEAERLPQNYLRKFIQTHPNIHLCLVNDGSQDTTWSIIDQLSKESPQQIFGLNLEQNQGKAEAVRLGLLHMQKLGKYEYLGYFDADMATPLDQVDFFLHFCQGSFTHSFIVGSRIKRLGAKVERSPLRHYLGRIFSTIASLILQLPVYDTQCGAKLIKAEVVPTIFEQPFLSKWLFDIEIFARLRGLYGEEAVEEEVMEIPLQVWLEKGDSRLKTKDLLRVFPELYRIHRRYKGNGKAFPAQTEAKKPQETGSV